jgi:hypothetical protein
MRASPAGGESASAVADGLDDEAFDAELRDASRRQDAEMREAQEELEEYVEAGRERMRDLGDVALEAMHRGDVVAVSVGERSFTGVVTHVGRDVFSVRDRFGNEVDVFIPALTGYRVAESVKEGGLPLRRTDPEQFRHCFFGPEASGQQVEVGGPRLQPSSGTVVVLAKDHVVMSDGAREWLVPLGAVGYLIRR